MKSGKTSFAAGIKKNLILACEKGYNFLSGATVQDITKWSDIKLVCRQLKKPEAKKLYNTVTFDTVSIAYDLCKDYICGKHGVQDLSEISWGRGYNEVQEEFETTLRDIVYNGYGMILLSHSKIRTEIDINGSETEIVSPSMDKRAAAVCNELVDIVGYLSTEFEDGVTKRYLYTRVTPTLFAGSRLKYLDGKIPFGYDQLVNAITRAIDKEASEGGLVSDKQTVLKGEEIDFPELRKEAEELWKKLIQKDKGNAKIVLEKIQEIMGQPMKLSEFTKEQKELLLMVVTEMKDMV